MTRREKCKSGFSLIEINLAIFVVGLGMLTLFSLFPTGLRQVEDAMNDTQMAMFSDFVFATLRSEARLVPADEWGPDAFAAFAGEIEAELDAQPYPGDSAIRSVRWGGGSDDMPAHMRYTLTFGSAGRDLVTATLWCQVGEFGPTGDGFKNQAKRFYTEFVYSGMP